MKDEMVYISKADCGASATREHMLGIIESGCGDFTSLNNIVRSALDAGSFLAQPAPAAAPA